MLLYITVGGILGFILLGPIGAVIGIGIGLVYAYYLRSVELERDIKELKREINELKNKKDM